MGFGGYLGLFIGASILSLYDISIKVFMKMVTKFNSRLDTAIKTEEFNKGQQETVLNDKSIQLTEKVFSTTHRISPVEMEQNWIKMQNDLAIQCKNIKKLEKLLAKQADILAKLEKLNKKKYVNDYSFRKEVWK